MTCTSNAAKKFESRIARGHVGIKIADAPAFKPAFEAFLDGLTNRNANDDRSRGRRHVLPRFERRRLAVCHGSEVALDATRFVTKPDSTSSSLAGVLEEHSPGAATSSKPSPLKSATRAGVGVGQAVRILDRGTVRAVRSTEHDRYAATGTTVRDDIDDAVAIDVGRNIRNSRPARG